MTAPPPQSRQTDDRPPAGDDPLLDSIRAILLQQDRDQVHRLQLEKDQLEQQVRVLQQQLTRLHGAAIANQEQIRELQSQLAQLGERVQLESQGLFARVVASLGEIIRLKIQGSRQEMVEVLYPIIGETIQRALAEFLRELQRNIDARINATFGPQGILRTLGARLRGVSPGQLALRDALPFHVRELFLIHYQTGLLIAHYGTTLEDGDRDLVSNMLTAIRDFVQDSFGDGGDDELEAIEYGDQRIIIQGGSAAYVAVVIEGIEPEGFHANLRRLVTDLHLQHYDALTGYSGRASNGPNYRSVLAQFSGEIGAAEAVLDDGRGRRRRRIIVATSLLGMLVVLLACFYIYFTIALLPTAFPGLYGGAAPLPALIQTPTATPTPAPTSSDMPQSLVTPAPPPTRMAVPFSVVTVGPVMARSAPGLEQPQTALIPAETSVELLAVYGAWSEVEWIGGQGPMRGWVPSQWLDVVGEIPPAIITPAT